MAGTTREVVRRVEATRTVDPGYALTEQTPAGVRSLCDATRMQAVVGPRHGPPFLLTPPIDGVARLLVRPDLRADDVVWRFAVNVGAQLAWFPRPCEDEGEARLVALAGIFHAEGMGRNDRAGYDWQHDRVTRIRDVPGLWGPDSFQSFLLRLDPILPRLRPSAPDLNQPISAGELYQLAHETRDEAGDFDTARAVFLHGARVAQRAHQWEEMVLCLSGLGQTCERLGHSREARRWLLRALRLTEKHELLSLRGEVLHDLFGVEAERENDAGAFAYAREAFRTYGPAHPKVLRFAQDVAGHLVSMRYYLRALPLLRALEGPADSGAVRVAVLCNLAIAAAGAGNSSAYERAAATLSAVAQEDGAGALAARAFLALAEAAILAERWEDARTAAEAAMACAARTAEAKTHRRAEVVAACAERRATLPVVRFGRGGAGGACWEGLVSGLEGAIRSRPRQPQSFGASA